jgi:sialate O-acetylesterase
MRDGVLMMVLFLVMGTVHVHAQSPQRIVDLRGDWRFEIGDDPARSAAAYDDSAWDRIRVPAFWEDEGYPGYDGWAWYRRHFTVHEQFRHDALFLDLGNIDDIDEVYVNGNFVGFMGAAPPRYETAYAEKRWYYLPGEFLRFGSDNVIAVRVYDHELGGGIIRGDIGLYRDPTYLVPDQSLRGVWKLKRGDAPDRAAPSFRDDTWERARVPSYWETQGLRGYDGFAWYRRTFTLAPALRDTRLILLLGRIDDADDVWVNGRRIGKTGRMPEEGGQYINDDAYRSLRAYALPPDVLHRDAPNVIAVRVFDGFRHGGIYEGPVGLIRLARYRAWERKHGSDQGNTVDRLLKFLFGE